MNGFWWRRILVGDLSKKTPEELEKMADKILKDAEISERAWLRFFEKIIDEKRLEKVREVLKIGRP
jgi:hypothetical protein